MLFTTNVFLFIFFPIIFAIYILLQKFNKIELQNIVLLIASLIFYSWGGIRYCILLIVCVKINYIIGLLIYKFDKNIIYKKIFFWGGIFINLFVLGIFKYLNFFIDSINNLGNKFGINISFVIPSIALPLGISFFTFSAISYLADVYLKKVNPQFKFINLALYIMLFPKLIMGPIVSYSKIENQITSRRINVDQIYMGLNRFIKGFCKKMLLASHMADIADIIFELQGGGNFIIAWVGAIAYALQIYIDFSSYTDMAIGLGHIFGFTFNENFNYPYSATSIQDFWRRWHITLSNWFRDYLYIPLGGNRKGKIRTYINLSIVFIFTGIWHGANWTFICWGIYHGIFMILERISIKKILERTPRLFSYVYTTFIVIVGWVIFRADSMTQAIIYLKSMMSFKVSNIWKIEFWNIINLKNITVFIISIIICFPIFKNKYKFSLLNNFILIILFIISIYIMLVSGFKPFIYLKF